MRRSDELFKQSRLMYILACAGAGIMCAIAKSSGKKEAEAELAKKAQDMHDAKVYTDMNFDVYEGEFNKFEDK